MLTAMSPEETQDTVHSGTVCTSGHDITRVNDHLMTSVVKKTHGLCFMLDQRNFYSLR